MKSSYHVLMGEAELHQVVVPSGIPGLSCVPSTMDLLGAELELSEVERKTHRLQDAIARLVRRGAGERAIFLSAHRLSAVAQPA